MQRAVFEEKIPAMLAASTFPAEKREGWIKRQAKLFTLPKFPDASFKQYYKNRVNIHSQVFDS